MNTKTLKILTTVATILLVIAMGATTVLGAELTPNQVKANASTNTVNSLNSIGGSILGVLQAVGTILAVIIITVIGIKYMLGSAEEKAEYKKTMMPYIIGAVIIFAAPTIANIVYNFGKNIGQ